MKLSAVLITLNSEATLQRCLESLSFADEIVVVDGGSLDSTQMIARSNGARVVEQPDWQGFGVQKNRAIDEAQHEWVLLLDSDEWVDGEAAEEILRVIADAGQGDPGQSVSAFRFRRRSRYLGQIVRHSGWWPDYVTRLFLKSAGRYSLDLVHERLVLAPGVVVGTLRSVIEHDAVLSIEQVHNKTNRYSSYSAEQMFARGRSSSVGLALFKGVWAFLRTYFMQLGLLDGRVGLLIALHTAETTFYRYLKLWVLGQRGGRSLSPEDPRL